MPNPAGGERPAEREADGGVVGEHPLREQLAAFAHSAGVVRKEHGIEQIGRSAATRNGRWIDPVFADFLQEVFVRGTASVAIVMRFVWVHVSVRLCRVAMSPQQRRAYANNI